MKRQPEVIRFYLQMWEDGQEVIEGMKEVVRYVARQAAKYDPLRSDITCSVCGGVGKRVETYHPDYTDPEISIRICRRCQAQRRKWKTTEVRRAAEAFMYLSGKVKERPEYRRFQQAKDALRETLSNLPTTPDEVPEWMNRRRKEERELWYCKLQITTAMELINDFYNPREDKLY